jgi:hypothetical protein
MKFLLLTFSLFVVASEASTIRKAASIPAKNECDPHQAISRMAASANLSCGPESHCVFDGNSSLGGYCHDNESTTSLEIPVSMRKVCLICESPDNMKETRGSVVTKFDDIIGAFTCGALEEMGKNAELPVDRCTTFQKTIFSNKVCGCANPDVVSNPVSETKNGSDGAYIYANHVDISDKVKPLTDEWMSPFGESGSTPNMMAVTGVAATIVATLALAF